MYDFDQYPLFFQDYSWLPQNPLIQPITIQKNNGRQQNLGQDQLLFEQTQDSRLKKVVTKSFKIPRSIFVTLFILIIGIIGFNQLVKNNLYGPECVAAAEEVKRSKFFETLKLLQDIEVDEKALEGGELGGNQDYGDIFGDPNLFKDFGGFDTKDE